MTGRTGSTGSTVVDDDPTTHEAPGGARHEPDWAARLGPRRRTGRRLQIALAALVLAAAGFVGGIVTTQQVEDSRAAELPGGLELPDGMELPEGMEIPEGIELPDLGGSGGSGGSGLLAGASGLGALTGGETSYTVVVVDGRTLYLEDAAGETVRVETRRDTVVRHLVRGKTTDLRPGDRVTVTRAGRDGAGGGDDGPDGPDGGRVEAVEQVG